MTIPAATPEAAGIHRYLTQNRMAAYTVLVDLMANHQLGEKTVLYLLDAVICAPGESVADGPSGTAYYNGNGQRVTIWASMSTGTTR